MKPRYPDDAVMQLAYCKFVYDNNTLAKVSVETRIPVIKLHDRAEIDHWRQDQEEVLAGVRERVADQLAHFAITRAMPYVRTVYDGFVDLSKKVNEQLPSTTKPKDLKDLSLAMRNAASLGHTALGLADPSLIDRPSQIQISNSRVQVNVLQAVMRAADADLTTIVLDSPQQQQQSLQLQEVPGERQPEEHQEPTTES